ncbi:MULTISPECIES: MogA/MoaB family molybdenum cofactor biosynthesis protein [Pseudanabaena]|uniref:Molybdenum cofactor biosynthesis protein B n=2 Tax=Pseudanabaena TaxID=1152 RepID=L8MV27_9CYAN|nr:MULTISPECIES: MogA/MoaB family molybdenum cofactor biosynthesis protein [Pseudanabaena]ELS30310.1 molybdenum cofactor synthesis domain protein [Pseudanabaena biceps PCC 7429]MDG3497408.1 MogA/MoaB family molybdenum cofactor biosynthesis protein [Pseudanabaena catenata USMAC16]
MQPSQNPCPDPPSYQVHFAVITVSDTRTPETDKSGNFIKQSMTNAGHILDYYALVKDEPDEIREQMLNLAAIADLDAIILNGGTGIAPRDTTYDAIAALLEKTLPGFGEMFRYLSWQEVGSRAIASRSEAGIYQGKLVFSLPGSSNAVKLAIEQLILPEIIHLVRQLKGLH